VPLKKKCNECNGDFFQCKLVKNSLHPKCNEGCNERQNGCNAFRIVIGKVIFVDTKMGVMTLVSLGAT